MFTHPSAPEDSVPTEASIKDNHTNTNNSLVMIDDDEEDDGGQKPVDAANVQTKVNPLVLMNDVYDDQMLIDAAVDSVCSKIVHSENGKTIVEEEEIVPISIETNIETEKEAPAEVTEEEIIPLHFVDEPRSAALLFGEVLDPRDVILNTPKVDHLPRCTKCYETKESLDKQNKLLKDLKVQEEKKDRRIKLLETGLRQREGVITESREIITDVNVEKHTLERENIDLREENKRMYIDLQARQKEKQEMNEKLQATLQNVNDLINEVKGRTEETKEKEEEIEIRKEENKKAYAKVKLLEENLCQVRNENTQVKNQLKTQKDSSLLKHLREYEDFKRTVSGKLEVITEHLNRVKKTPEKKNEKKKQSPINNKIEDQTKKKPQLNNKDLDRKRYDISIISVSDGDLSEEEVYSKGSPIRYIPTVPGEHIYSDVVRKPQQRPYKKISPGRNTTRNTMIISTSITRDIKYQEFNDNYNQGRAQFQRFKGGSAEYIKDYIPVHLKKEKPDSALVQIGGNDLQKAYTTKLLTSLANQIIETGQTCREHNVKTVFIGGVTVRQQQYTWERCKQLNVMLQDLCKKHQFIYVDNSNITVNELSDGTHLNEKGTIIMANNFLDTFNKEFGFGNSR